MTYICGKVLRPPPPHLIYATEEPQPLPPPRVIPPRDALLREVRRILPWKDTRWKKAKIPRKTPPRVFYVSPLPLLALPPPRVILALPPPPIQLLLPPPPERGFILVGGGSVQGRIVIRRRRVDPCMFLPPPRRRRFAQEPPPEHEIYREMVIKPPGKLLKVFIILLTLPSWVILWVLGAFTLREMISGFKRI
jgi:hypothetical protein